MGQIVGKVMIGMLFTAIFCYLLFVAIIELGWLLGILACLSVPVLLVWVFIAVSLIVDGHPYFWKWLFPSQHGRFLD